MALDTKYIPSTIFQEGILDKDTGEPLAGGKVWFFRDNDRTEPSGLKTVYQLSGSPPSYTYVALPNPITLSAIGTIQDGSNNDVIPYFYPYDADGDVDLYYVKVVSSGGVEQFTREGVPNVSDTQEESEEIINYANNGQFLLHNNITADPVSGRVEGEITGDGFRIAPPDWQFLRPNTSTAKDFAIFERVGSYTDIPDQNPRYILNLKCTQIDGTDTFKYLSLGFDDVNKFASDEDNYTYGFQGKSNSGIDITVDVLVRKVFGTGGDAPVIENKGSLTLTTNYQFYDLSFVVGNNIGKILGDNDDDYIEILLSLPATSLYDVDLVNFIFAKGEIEYTQYPLLTDHEVTNQTVFNRQTLPDYDGYNLYLPVILESFGFTYDIRDIGNPFMKLMDRLYPGEKWADGSKYVVSSYSTEGIPYKRVYDVWSYGSNIGMPIYGCGDDEMHLIGAASPTYKLSSESAGAVTPAGDGSIPTGFTFTPIAPNPYEVSITAVAASSITGGSFWNYFTTDARKYIIWFKVNGVGTQPVESADVYIEVTLTGSEDASEVMRLNAIAVNSYSVRFPDMRGYFIRSTDMGAGIDPDAGSRTSRRDGVSGDNVGTKQTDEYKSHFHVVDKISISGSPKTLANGTDQGYELDSGTTASSGGLETRPKNIYTNIAIRY